MGDSGEVVLRLRPGTHVIACVRRGEDGHRHASRGEASAWMEADDPGEHATAIGGVARIGPSEAAYLRLDLAPGTYVLHCLVPDRAEARPHIALGMLKVVHVE